jgi:SpoVK/Ycf46/Vps4 family AAA+-type ATPase
MFKEDIKTSKLNFRWVLLGFPEVLSPQSQAVLNLIKLRLSKVCAKFSVLYPEAFVTILRHDKSSQNLNVTISLSRLSNYLNKGEGLQKAFQELSHFISKNHQSIFELDITEIAISPDINNFKRVSDNDKNSELLLESQTDPIWRFADLVISDDLFSQLENILLLVQHQELIFDVWGLRKIQPAPKLIINFYGPPGTGKTMAAHALAEKIEKKLIEFSYAQIESKYVGEGPKNLHRAFELAKKTGAILFFDEADSLLGKRIENISEGSEQAINSMRSQMLIEIDKFEGVVVFATNMIQNYDFGFDSRLLHFKFDLPDRPLRKKMFMLYFLDSLPGKSYVDFDVLADLSEGFSGRNIRDVIIIVAGQIAKNQSQIKENITAILQNSIDLVKSTKRLLEASRTNTFFSKEK